MLADADDGDEDEDGGGGGMPAMLMLQLLQQLQTAGPNAQVMLPNGQVMGAAPLLALLQGQGDDSDDDDSDDDDG